MGNNIGERLRELRKLAGLSQMKLADKVGVSYQQIQKYEKGTSKLSVPRLLQLAEIFGVPFASIIDEDAPLSGTAVASNFSQEEIDLVLLYRQIASKPIRDGVLKLIKDVARALKAKR